MIQTQVRIILEEIVIKVILLNTGEVSFIPSKSTIPCSVVPKFPSYSPETHAQNASHAVSMNTSTKTTPVNHA